VDIVAQYVNLRFIGAPRADIVSRTIFLEDSTSLSKSLQRKTFLDAANTWVCDDYFLDFRYIAETTENHLVIWDASISLLPLPPKIDLSFQVESAGFSVGQIQQSGMGKPALIELLSEAANGTVNLLNKCLILQSDCQPDLYSDMNHREKWFWNLQLLLSGSAKPQPTSEVMTAADNGFRSATPPFDGFGDLASWLGLREPGVSGGRPTLALGVGPPVGLVFEHCSLSQDQLHLTFHAHPKFDVTHFALALRVVPGIVHGARRQASKEVNWDEVRDGRREGIARIRVENAESVLLMIMVGNSTIQRQWILDPLKAPNSRLVATQHFDKDLRMLKQAVMESPDSAKFEMGIALLLFLLGFCPSLQVETDAPDLIVTTPLGKLVLVECTTRIADFASKVGKLVDRRGALSKHLNDTGHASRVISVLVCRLPRDQIAAQAEDLRNHKTVLLAREDLLSAFDRVRYSFDPDKELDVAVARLTNAIAPNT
jgi:hypothetical protein